MNANKRSKVEREKELAEAFRSLLEENNKNDFFYVFQNHFKDREEFEKILDNFKEDKFKIIRIGFFYYWAIKVNKQLGIILIAIFSIMEAGVTEKYLTFDQWVLLKKSAQRHIIPN